ncbi:MAG TPA: hypothetical protein VGM22_24900 [Methylomirabilota bacterium]|jgi:predicted Rossmann-fold nucleotide-binding protein
MGGSSASRDELWYRRTAQTARLLAREKFFVMTGGGPGMMEAGNLGAYLADYEESALDEAIDILQKAPTYERNHKPDPQYVATALAVRDRFRTGRRNLGVPTWFYGFEPTNMFATDVAKYFANSRREAGILQITKGGAVFAPAPGSAGTRQEIFMGAAQNHYGTTGVYSPMVFLGRKQYEQDAPVYQLLQTVANQKYKHLLSISDDPADLVSFIKSHRP